MIDLAPNTRSGWAKLSVMPFRAYVFVGLAMVWFGAPAVEWLFGYGDMPGRYYGRAHAIHKANVAWGFLICLIPHLIACHVYRRGGNAGQADRSFRYAIVCFMAFVLISFFI